MSKPKMAKTPKTPKTPKAAPINATPIADHPDGSTPEQPGAEFLSGVEDSAGLPTADPVTSTQSPASPLATQPGTPAGATTNMDLTLNLKPGARKSDRLVIFDYTDRKGSVQFLRTLFGETIPTSITISGDFVTAPTPKVKVVETKEERKARLAAMPKLTLAEKVAKAEEKAAALRAKLAKKTGATEQPSA